MTSNILYHLSAALGHGAVATRATTTDSCTCCASAATRARASAATRARASAATKQTTADTAATTSAAAATSASSTLATSATSTALMPSAAVSFASMASLGTTASLTSAIHLNHALDVDIGHANRDRLGRVAGHDVLVGPQRERIVHLGIQVAVQARHVAPRAIVSTAHALIASTSTSPHLSVAFTRTNSLGFSHAVC